MWVKKYLVGSKWVVWDVYAPQPKPKENTNAKS